MLRRSDSLDYVDAAASSGISALILEYERGKVKR